MAVHTKVYGKVVNLMVRDIIEVKLWNIMEVGWRISCMAMGWLSGRMAGVIKGGMSMARSRGMGFISTPMAGGILASGCRGFSMAMERCIPRQAISGRAGGSMGKRSILNTRTEYSNEVIYHNK